MGDGGRRRGSGGGGGGGAHKHTQAHTSTHKHTPTHARGQGEVFKGAWENDKQGKGLFTDTRGRKWKGDFKAKSVKLVTSNTAKQQQATSKQLAQHATSTAH